MVYTWCILWKRTWVTTQLKEHIIRYDIWCVCCHVHCWLKMSAHLLPTAWVCFARSSTHSIRFKPRFLCNCIKRCVFFSCFPQISTTICLTANSSSGSRNVYNRIVVQPKNIQSQTWIEQKMKKRISFFALCQSYERHHKLCEHWRKYIDLLYLHACTHISFVLSYENWDIFMWFIRLLLLLLLSNVVSFYVRKFQHFQFFLLFSLYL